ncbi:hypothetical protein Tco_0629186 [Tanacetum coccineum]|uniref:Uncharacterized protein n=1 Tax=Tanacetum coccineum TaxID=301880 RepID=A0ABQ4WSD6_9ASTR
MKRVSKGFSGVITPLFDTMLVQHQGEEPSIQTTPETSPSKITSSPSLSSHHTSQPPITPTEEAASMPHESPLHSVHSLGRDEGSKARKRARIVISEDKDVAEDSSEQGRKIYDINTDPTISLVQPQQDMEYDFNATASIPVTTTGLEISTANIAVSIVDAVVTTDSSSISTVIPLRVSTAFNVEQEARFKAEQEQERIDFETALELQRQLDEREEVAAKEAHDID